MMEKKPKIKGHSWNDTYCSCGQDSVTCQLCGRQVCAELTSRKQVRGHEGNVCLHCINVYLRSDKHECVG